jgi:hypothetical protein
MKKLLVLVMILGLCTVTNAAIVSLSLDGVTAAGDDADIMKGTPITLSVISDTADYAWLMEVSVLKANATLGTPALTAKAGGMAGFNDYSDASVWDYELSIAGAPGSVQAGEQVTMSLTGTGLVGSTFVVNLGPYGAAPVDSIEFSIVPEPVTIGLLGLGALFLRRRK